jgi:tricorn protease
VDNLPHSTFKGKDAQLDSAIAHLKELIQKYPKDVPEPPPYPDKTFKKK